MNLQEILARNKLMAGGATAQHIDPRMAEQYNYQDPTGQTLQQGTVPQGNMRSLLGQDPQSEMLRRYFDMIQQGYQPQR